jgi:hypothetical protein
LRGAEPFAQWVSNGIKILFAGNLLRHDLKSAGGARWSLVGTNGGQSTAWRRLRDSYGVQEARFFIWNEPEVTGEALKLAAKGIVGTNGRVSFVVSRGLGEWASAAERVLVKQAYDDANMAYVILPVAPVSRWLKKVRIQTHGIDYAEKALAKTLNTFMTAYAEMDAQPRFNPKKRKERRRGRL